MKNERSALKGLVFPFQSASLIIYMCYVRFFYFTVHFTVFPATCTM